MQYVTVKGVDKAVSRIGLGGEQLGGHGWGRVTRDGLVGAVRQALDSGITLFDTAPIYGLGESEVLLGEQLRFRRDEVVIATKCGLAWTAVPQFRKWPDGSPESVRAKVEGSLRRLLTDYVDVCQVHWPDPATPLEDTLGALADLRTEGKIRAIGCCNFSAELLRRAFSMCDVSVVQIPYNLIDRSAATDILPLCREHGAAVFAYSPLARGLLTGKYASGSEFGPADNRSRHPYVVQREWREWPSTAMHLAEIALSLGRPSAQLAVDWVLATEGVSAALVGAKSPEQIEAVCAEEGDRRLAASLFNEIGETVKESDFA